MIQVKRLNDKAKIPTYANAGDAGADLYSTEEVTILPRGFSLISTGISLALPSNVVALVHPRSGLAAKHGVTVLNAPGTIDSGYRGEVKVILINHGPNPYTVHVGDRIAQLVFQEFMSAHFEEVHSLDTSMRGVKGFGSSGGLRGTV